MRVLTKVPKTLITPNGKNKDSMNKIDEIEQIITMGYGNPRERAEQILALFSVSN